jgi:hypothetical protein
MIDGLREQIARLERRLSLFEKQFIREAISCPICFGDGELIIPSQQDLLRFDVYRTDALGRNYRKCITCNGKGILWK